MGTAIVGCKFEFGQLLRGGYRTHIQQRKGFYLYSCDFLFFLNGVLQCLFKCFFSFGVSLQEVQTEPVLNALRDTRRKGRCKTSKERLPSAHLPIGETKEYSKSESG